MAQRHENTLSLLYNKIKVLVTVRAVFVGHGFHATHIYVHLTLWFFIFAGPQDAIVKDAHIFCDGGDMRAGLLEKGPRAGHRRW